MSCDLDIRNLIQEYTEPEYEKLSEIINDLNGDLKKLKNVREKEAKEKTEARCRAIQKMQSEIEEYAKRLDQVLGIKADMETLHPHREQIEKVNAAADKIKAELDRRENWIKELYELLPAEFKENFPDLEKKNITDEKQKQYSQFSENHGSNGGSFANNDPYQRNGKLLNELSDLRKEILKAKKYLPTRPKKEIFFQMSIWGGKLRCIQFEADGKYEVVESAKRIFNILDKLSDENRPGSIAAFKRNYDCDWKLYIEDNQKKLNEFIEEKRRWKDLSDLELRKEEKRKSEGEIKLRELKDAIHQNAATEVFCELSLATYNLLKSDPRLLNLITDRKEELVGREYKAIRRAIKKLKPPEKDNKYNSEEIVDEQEENYISKIMTLQHLLPARRRFAIVGGIRNNDLIKKLDKTLKTDEISWVESDNGKMSGFDNLAKSIKEKGTDAVIVLTVGIPHNCATLNKVLESSDVSKFYVNNFSYVSIMEKIIESLESRI